MMTVTNMLRPVPLFGNNNRPAPNDGLSEADRYVSGYFKMDGVSPEEVLARLAELREKVDSGQLAYDQFYGNASIPDIDKHRNLFTELKEAASLDIVFRGFPFGPSDPVKRPFTIAWDEKAPEFKQSNAVARAVGPLWPFTAGEKAPEAFAFPFQEVGATVKMNPDQPGPVRAWRYEKNGRHHRVAVAWQNPDESRQYLLFEDKVGNFDSPFRREGTSLAFDVFKRLNRFLANNYRPLQP